MSMAKKSLTGLVRASVEARGPRHKTWFERIDPEHQKELLAIKRSWREGALKSSALRLAEDISRSCRELGISTIGKQGVIQWLQRD
jgi:hypothetical protein